MHLVTSLAIHNNFFSLLQVYNFQEITGAILLLLGITHVLIICTKVRFRRCEVSYYHSSGPVNKNLFGFTIIIMCRLLLL